MNILIITNALAKGGAEKLLETTIPKYQLRGINVTLLLLNQSTSEKTYIQTIEDAGIPIIDLKSKSYYTPSAILKIRKVIQQNKFDIIHVHLFPALYWTALAYKMTPSHNKTRLVYTEHSNSNNRRNKPFFKLIDKFIYKSYKKIIAITEEVKTNLISWIGSDEKLIVINNGVDLEKINQTISANKSSFTKQLNIPHDATIILMVASFRYPKDQVTLIKAINHIDKNVHVLFAGEGPQMENVKKVVTTENLSNKIHFLGHRNDIYALMKMVDINVLSSSYEGLSGVTLESLASGKPFLGSDVSGINDVVPDERFLFEKGNDKYLASQINKIIVDKKHAKDMSIAGTVFVKKMDINNMVDKYCHLYSLLLKQ